MAAAAMIRMNESQKIGKEAMFRVPKAYEHNTRSRLYSIIAFYNPYRSAIVSDGSHNHVDDFFAR